MTRSPALAIAWEFRMRHRWGLMSLAGYLLVLTVIRIVLLQSHQRIHYSDEQSFAFLVLVPLSATFMYLLAVFSFGLAGDLAARQSIYPARMFTLPVRSSALVSWPMTYGAAAMMILWMITRLFAPWPEGLDVPWIWPGVLAAALLAWTQALTWMPYALRGLRVIVTVLWLTMIDAVVMLALEFKASELVMLAIVAPNIPLAYLVARFAVVRARRGAVPDLRRMLAWSGAIVDMVPRRRDHFTSPAGAQVWFEWRKHGRSLPALVAILLPFELFMLFLFRDTPAIVLKILFVVLFTPPFMAAFVAATVSKSNPHGSDAYTLTPFVATRPLSSAGMIAAKLKMTLRSTLAAWLLVLVAVPLGLKFSGAWPIVHDAAREASNLMGMPRAIVIGLLGLLAFLASTWKQLVKSLYIGLSGREWLVKANVFFVLSLLALIGPFLYWLNRNPRVIGFLWDAFPWLAALLVCIKMSATAWIAMRLHNSRLVSDRMLVVGAGCWCAIVFALYGVLEWIFPEQVVRMYIFALIAILAVPLVRLSAVLLALPWSRHGSQSLPGGIKIQRKSTVMPAMLLFIVLPPIGAIIDITSFFILNRNNGSIISSGELRKYLLYVPTSYDRNNPTPLVISMHGAGGWPAQQMQISQWNRLAESETFIVVYPSGQGNGPRVWHASRGPGLMKDVQFISDLIDELQKDYNIDSTMIYANGLSNGGGMAFVLSCTLSERIAAVGLVASAQTLPFQWCTDVRPLPMIAFHGTADQFTPYKGGTSWVSRGLYFPSIPAWVANWARRNQCEATPVESAVGNDVRLREYKNCADEAVVNLYTIDGGGHTWPGGKPLPEWFAGSTTRSIDASSLMWDFFREHPLRVTQTTAHR